MLQKGKWKRINGWENGRRRIVVCQKKMFWTQKCSRHGVRNANVENATCRPSARTRSSDTLSKRRESCYQKRNVLFRLNNVQRDGKNSHEPPKCKNKKQNTMRMIRTRPRNLERQVEKIRIGKKKMTEKKVNMDLDQQSRAGLFELRSTIWQTPSDSIRIRTKWKNGNKMKKTAN